MNDNRFLARLAEGKTLVIDGATGTNLQQRGLPRGMASDAWVLENPSEVQRLHKAFLAAGSDIILTDTFGSTHIRLEHAGLQERTVEINQKAVMLAKEAVAGTTTLVAGSIGPTGQMLQPMGTLTEDAARDAFAEQAKALAEAGVDLLVIETQFDLGEARAAIEGARSVCSLPLVCSFSYDRGVRTMMGVKPAQMARELGDLVDVLGINCGRSLEDNLKVLKELRQATEKPIWFKPNAGLPRTLPNDQVAYDVTPEQMGAQAPIWVAEGARLVGGCCGTSPEHLAAIAASIKG